MSNGTTITVNHPTGGDGLTTEQLDTVRGETYRRVVAENEYLRRERNTLTDLNRALSKRAVLAEEQLAIALRRIERLVRMEPEHLALLRECGAL